MYAGQDMLAYDGSLGGVLAELEIALLTPGSRSPLLALHPPRVIRAVIDHKIAHPDAPNAENLVRHAIKLGLHIYKGAEGAANQLKEFRTAAQDSGIVDLLTQRLRQPSDLATWEASSSIRSQASAERLFEQTYGKDVLFIALAHGGVAAGMDVYLRYADMAKSEDSEFYTCRYSTHKADDEKPQLIEAEINYLQEMARGKEVVIFDEDKASGGTLREAVRFFSDGVFPTHRVIPLTNLDMRAEIQATGFKFKIQKDVSQKAEHTIIKHMYKKNFLKPKETPPHTSKGQRSQESVGNKNKTKLFQSAFGEAASPDTTYKTDYKIFEPPKKILKYKL